MLLLDRPTPTQFPASILYTPLDNTLLHSTLYSCTHSLLYNKCVTLVGLLTVVESSSKKTNYYLWLRSITFRSHHVGA